MSEKSNTTPTSAENLINEIEAVAQRKTDIQRLQTWTGTKIDPAKGPVTEVQKVNYGRFKDYISQRPYVGPTIEDASLFPNQRKIKENLSYLSDNEYKASGTMDEDSEHIKDMGGDLEFLQDMFIESDEPEHREACLEMLDDFIAKYNLKQSEVKALRGYLLKLETTEPAFARSAADIKVSELKAKIESTRQALEVGAIDSEASKDGVEAARESKFKVGQRVRINGEDKKVWTVIGVPDLTTGRQTYALIRDVINNQDDGDAGFEIEGKDASESDLIPVRLKRPSKRTSSEGSETEVIPIVAVLPKGIWQRIRQKALNAAVIARSQTGSMLGQDKKSEQDQYKTYQPFLWEKSPWKKYGSAAILAGGLAVGSVLAIKYGFDLFGGDGHDHVANIPQNKGNSINSINSAESYAYSWDWAHDRWGNNAGKALHKLGSMASNDGHDVKWHGSGSKSWLSIDGNSHAQYVIKVLKGYKLQ